MIFPRQILTPAVIVFIFPLAVVAQQSDWQVKSMRENSSLKWDLLKGTATATNGISVQYGGAVLTAERATVDMQTGECVADGDVHIQRDNQVWIGEHIRYNFKTRQMESDSFRTGKTPVFAAGENLHGDLSNRVFTASHAFITTDDVSEPKQRIRATSIKIVPGEYVEAHNAVFYLDEVPVFYTPYYRRRLGEHANHFNFTPGYRSSDGAFLLSTYTIVLNEQVDGALHLDYRQKRGVGTGADTYLHLDQWGEASFKYYYAHDLDPNFDSSGLFIPADRDRAYFSYIATPFTNLYVKSRVSYESDDRILHDFFESDYRRDPQPSTYADVNKLWPNFSLDVYAQPRINDFRETVERLPDVKLTAFRQKLGPLPVFYESESSGGWYQRLFSETNNPSIPDYSAFRGDTFHQLTLPCTFFGWLNMTPRAGGRFTYYDCSDATNTASDGISRGVFNTGMEISFKASQLWPAAKNNFLDVDGVRHIIEPSVNYAYVPTPNQHTNELPQFDFELPDYRQLPLDFPDYNSIDSIDSQNTLRLRLRNKLQTKRNGHVENLAGWDVYTDWRLRRYHDEETFSDVFSDLVLKPRSWMTIESVTRWDSDNADLNMALHYLSLQPGSVWNWSIGHWYVRDGFMDDEGSSAITSTLFWRLTENWACRAGHYFDARDGQLREQSYSIYRDLRSWTAALTFRVRDNTGGKDDFAVAFTFSLKAAPHFPLGSDTVRPNSLLGN